MLWLRGLYFQNMKKNKCTNLTIFSLLSFLFVAFYIFKNSIDLPQKTARQIQTQQKIKNEPLCAQLNKPIEETFSNYSSFNNLDYQWDIYKNPIYNFSFQYPIRDGFVIREDSGHSGDEGVAGSALYNINQYEYGPIFKVEVLYSKNFKDIDELSGGLDVRKEKFTNENLKSLAQLSRDANLQKEPCFPNKKVSEVRQYHFQNGIGYGFAATDTFNTCLHTEPKCDSGGVVPRPSHHVFVMHGHNLYRIQYSIGILGEQIFSTFHF